MRNSFTRLRFGLVSFEKRNFKTRQRGFWDFLFSSLTSRVTNGQFLERKCDHKATASELTAIAKSFKVVAFSRHLLSGLRHDAAWICQRHCA